MRVPIGLKSKKYSGMEVIIDDEDYNIISQYSWYPKPDANTFYAETNVRKEDGSRGKLQLHRLVLPTKEDHIDHMNGNGLDNRKGNLRPCTKLNNWRNAKKKNTPSLSKYKGVTFDKTHSVWTARIRSQPGKRITLGRFKNEIDAAKIYNKAALYYFGEFAHLNKVD